MKQLIILFVLVLSGLQMNAQTADEYPAIERSTDWVLYQEVDGVKQYYKFQECNIPSEGYYREHVLIKLENSTSAVKTVEWDNVMWYGSTCINCDESSQEEHRSFVLQPATAQEATCALEQGMALKLFSKFLNYQMDDWVLTHFEFRNFSVK
jgi:hypothetical protein